MKSPAFMLVAALLFATAAFADSMSPPTQHVGSSSDGRFVVRIASKIQLFGLSDDEKSYRLISAFDSLSEGTPLEALVTDDGRFIVTLDGGRGMGRGRDVVSVFESSGRKLKEWSLSEILEKEDLDVVISSVSSTWWRKEVVIPSRGLQLIVTGPFDQPFPAKRHYWYQLNLERLKWAKLR